MQANLAGVATAASEDEVAAGIDVVVLAGSAGGMKAVMSILPDLPSQLPAAVVVVLHRPVAADDHLPALLQRGSALPVAPLCDGGALRPGTVSVLPGRVGLTHGIGGLQVESLPTARTIDPTLQAVAAAFGRRSLAVVLSGRLDDGAAGARAIKRAGGRVVVQDPADAAESGMPTATLATGSVDFVLPVRQVSACIVALTMAPGGADLLRTARSAWAT